MQHAVVKWRSIVEKSNQEMAVKANHPIVIFIFMLLCHGVFSLIKVGKFRTRFHGVSGTVFIKVRLL